VTTRFQLQGTMIPRADRRMVDHRSEPRVDADQGKCSLRMRGRDHDVTLVNWSPSGAMIRFDGDAHIGEPLTLQLLDREAVHGQVRWWRDGRMGIGFGQPLE
jgi:hypothetical protein